MAILITISRAGGIIPVTDEETEVCGQGKDLAKGAQWGARKQTQDFRL